MLEKLLKFKKPTTKSGAEKYVVGLDIGTEFIKALVGRARGNHVEIIGVGRERQELSAMQSGAVADIASVVEKCDLALTTAEQIAGVDVREAVIGLAGELVKGTTTTIRYRRSEPKNALTFEEIQQIVSKAQAKSYAQARKQLALEIGNANVDVRLVHSALVGITIDGLAVTNPVGFQGSDVAIQLYSAFAPMIHIGALERIAEELDLKLITLAAQPFAVARSVLGEDSTNNLSALLIDVGGGTTDIALVHNGGVMGTQMFGIGGRAFTRSIASSLGLEFAIAEDRKIKLNQRKGDIPNRTEVLEAIQRTLDVWISGVQLALEEFDSDEHLPNSILLCGGGASLDQLVGALSETDWYKELPFTKPPVIQYITPMQVSGMVDKTNQLVDHTFITAMGLIRVGVDTVVTTDEDSSWRTKIDRMLAI